MPGTPSTAICSGLPVPRDRAHPLSHGHLARHGWLRCLSRKISAYLIELALAAKQINEVAVHVRYPTADGRFALLNCRADRPANCPNDNAENKTLTHSSSDGDTANRHYSSTSPPLGHLRSAVVGSPASIQTRWFRVGVVGYAASCMHTCPAKPLGGRRASLIAPWSLRVECDHEGKQARPYAFLPAHPALSNFELQNSRENGDKASTEPSGPGRSPLRVRATDTPRRGPSTCSEGGDEHGLCEAGSCCLLPLRHCTGARWATVSRHLYYRPRRRPDLGRRAGEASALAHRCLVRADCPLRVVRPTKPRRSQGRCRVASGLDASRTGASSPPVLCFWKPLMLQR